MMQSSLTRMEETCDIQTISNENQTIIAQEKERAKIFLQAFFYVPQSRLDCGVNMMYSHNTLLLHVDKEIMSVNTSS
jgi:hypothetical protein